MNLALFGRRLPTDCTYLYSYTKWENYTFMVPQQNVPSSNLPPMRYARQDSYTNVYAHTYALRTTTCAHKHTHTYIHTYIHIYLYSYIHILATYTDDCMHGPNRVHNHTHAHAYGHRYARTRTHTHTHTHNHAYTQRHTYTHRRA